MSMSENDPRRMDEIRRYAAIYGRFDCKRRPEKPLTLHEVSVNEAAAQICRFVPALLTRRDELFPLARQVVKDSGCHYSKTQWVFYKRILCNQHNITLVSIITNLVLAIKHLIQSNNKGKVRSCPHLCFSSVFIINNVWNKVIFKHSYFTLITIYFSYILT